ncbi:hypothetical protein TIFTF001_018390 [Ficus carica]|uniref:Uncharacterized protein n=1 Tax=Ficus carica TaxID=3494 RepID=A0AA88ADX7_FICCA|nr:hypothetical protein TIFTF001_018390 [Ficus carica]
MVPATTPNEIGYLDQYSPVTPPSITCKMEALRNDGDTGVVSAAGTPMLKSVRVLMQGERQSFDKARMTIPGSEGFSSIYRGYQPNGWVPRGPRRCAVSSRTQRASPARGQQCLSERGTEGWLSLTVDPARAGGAEARLALLPGSRCSEHNTVRVRTCSDENAGGGRPKDIFSENVRP